MKVLTTYMDALNECLASKYVSIAHLHKDTPVMDVHSHRCYEFYFSISGGRTFRIDEKDYRIEPGNVFLINQYESRQITQLDVNVPHERIVVFIDPSYLNRISTPKTDLSYCFTHRAENFSHRLTLSEGQQRRFSYYISKLTAEETFGSDVEERSCFADFMVFMTRLCLEAQSHTQETRGGVTGVYNTKTGEIITYICQNIDSPLSIADIASHFYLSASYLCRLFKHNTGMTINTFITKRRIDLAQSLLSEGYSVNEVYGMCGFNDYSNFFKAFTKNVGISPKKYSQNCLRL